MQVFSSIQCSLPKLEDNYSAFSGQEYTVYGVVSEAVTSVLLDGEKVFIAPTTLTWTKTFKAPNTGVITVLEHSIQYFGKGTNPHDLGSGANYIKITIQPVCS